MKVVASNKFANFNYFILETYEAGIVLKGSEIKSIRQNGMTLNESFILIKQNQVFLKNSFVKSYQTANNFSPKPDRDRLLLLNKSEILKLKQKVETKGLTIVPIKAYLKDDLLKLEIGLCKGKKLFNKKDDKKEQDIKRETERYLNS
ncbi:MAG: SsrA-binding protein SmpB [Clostridia bacterium]|nr:SsrA-binding protein SmpB [Clostridia bacterium]